MYLLPQVAAEKEYAKHDLEELKKSKDWDPSWEDNQNVSSEFWLGVGWKISARWFVYQFIKYDLLFKGRVKFEVFFYVCFRILFLHTVLAFVYSSLLKGRKGSKVFFSILPYIICLQLKVLY